MSDLKYPNLDWVKKIFLYDGMYSASFENCLPIIINDFKVTNLLYELIPNDHPSASFDNRENLYSFLNSKKDFCGYVLAVSDKTIFLELSDKDFIALHNAINEGLEITELCTDLSKTVLTLPSILNLLTPIFISNTLNFFISSQIFRNNNSYKKTPKKYIRKKREAGDIDPDANQKIYKLVLEGYSHNEILQSIRCAKRRITAVTNSIDERVVSVLNHNLFYENLVRRETQTKISMSDFSLNQLQELGFKLKMLKRSLSRILKKMKLDSDRSEEEIKTFENFKKYIEEKIKHEKNIRISKQGTQ